MQLTKLVYRKVQKSILRVRDDNIEIRALFNVEHDGKRGSFLYEAIIRRREIDTSYFCDINGVTKDTVMCDDHITEALEVGVFNMKPEHDETTPEIERTINSLLSKPLA